MKTVFTTLAVILAANVRFRTSAAEKPNIIVILTDDMGYAELPLFGDSEVPAPNLEILASFLS